MSPTTLLISGSPRSGNTEYVLLELQERIQHNCEILLLRNKKIHHCRGCLYCHHKADCSIKNDDMQTIRTKIGQANNIVIGSPNYFDNISGLLKNFIDRLHPLYKEKKLKGKKLIQCMVGGGGIEGTQKHLNHALYGLTRHLYLDLIGSYSFQALHPHDLQQHELTTHIIEKMAQKINAL